MAFLRSVFVCLAVCVWVAAAELGEFAPCVEKNRLAFEKAGSFTSVAIDSGRLLVALGLLNPDRLPKAWSLERYDPLFGFAIVKTVHNRVPIVFREADRISEHKNLLLLSQAEEVIIPSASLKRQLGTDPARVLSRSSSGALLTAPCYAVVGISMFGAIVESDFLERFIEGDDSFSWGDLGFRLEGNIVRYINPFTPNNPFLEGDRIAKINGVVYETPREIERAILFLKPGDEANVTIERGGASAELKAKVVRRLGGFLKADTFLEHIGWNLSSDLVARSIDNHKLPIRAGDRIVTINGSAVKTPKEARAVLSGYRGSVRLLMQRDEFQFFIAIETEQK
ncbi:MAG: PDZ domain-containing protein [Helicobacteraceae bacterium]|jgi:hypothetical protein|nr:PDZ domain-containing protein [Helicobacteraceae bacterium]